MKRSEIITSIINNKNKGNKKKIGPHIDYVRSIYRRVFYDSE